MHSNNTDWTACQELIRHGSHSFFMASWLLPQSVAVPATALYAFCRVADDLIDNETPAPGHERQAINALSQRLDAIYANSPEDYPEDRALAEVVHQFNIPRSMPDALIEGLSWDTDGRSYQTLSELYDYCARVAACVGAMMTLIMGARDERAMARAL